MSQISDNALKTGPKRLLKDKVAKYGVMLGGVMVLCALLLIFLYLLYVVQPIFNSAHIEQKYDINDLSKTYHSVAIEEQNEIAYALTESGIVDFYSVKGSNKGSLIHSEQVPLNNSVTSFAQSAPHLGLYAYFDTTNAITLVKPFFRVSFPGNVRQLTPVVNYPFGEEALSLGDDGLFQIESAAFAVEEQSIGAVYQLTNQQVYFSKLVGEENMFTEEFEWTTTQIHLDMIRDTVKSFHVSPDLSLSQTKKYMY